MSSLTGTFEESDSAAAIEPGLVCGLTDRALVADQGEGAAAFDRELLEVAIGPPDFDLDGISFGNVRGSDDENCFHR